MNGKGRSSVIGPPALFALRGTSKRTGKLSEGRKSSAAAMVNPLVVDLY